MCALRNVTRAFASVHYAIKQSAASEQRIQLTMNMIKNYNNNMTCTKSGNFVKLVQGTMSQLQLDLYDLSKCGIQLLELNVRLLLWN